MEPNRVAVTNLRGKADPLGDAAAKCPHNYLLKLQWLAEQRRLSGDSADMAVEHDGSCRIHQGGYCNCDPDIRMAGKLIQTPAIAKLLRRQNMANTKHKTQ